MSLDVYIYDPTATYWPYCLYESNITHNLWRMAREAWIYEPLWMPVSTSWKKVIAEDLILLIEKWLELLKSDPERFEKFNSPNGRWLYEHFIPFVEDYLEALKRYPKGIIETCA